MNNKKMRLTESELQQVVENSVRKILMKEGWFKKAGDAIDRFENWTNDKLDNIHRGYDLKEGNPTYIFDVIKGDDEEISCAVEYKLDIKEIAVLAVATSIDALAVGISMAFLHVNILSAVSTIGVTTFILASIGVLIGNKFGVKYKDKATIAGGVILILIGTKILLEHLGIIA